MKGKGKIFKLAAATVISVFASGIVAVAQRTPQVSPVRPVIVSSTPGIPSEKFIDVDAKPTVSLCVSGGAVKVTGWDRDEIRAFVDGGGSVGFKVAERNPKTDKAAWVFVLGFDPQSKVAGKTEECLAGETIELDVPREASVNIKGSPEETRIESVGKVRVENITGNIVLRNIGSGAWATTYDGAIMIERSSGPITLTSTSGGIVAFDVGQREVGDAFKARSSSGSVTLQSVGYRQLDVSTISGQIVYRGKLLGGGQYTFGSQNARVLLTLPASSACKVNAWYGAGAFSSEIPLQNETKSGPGTTGQLGKGETNCSIYLKTTSGQLRIVTESPEK